MATLSPVTAAKVHLSSSDAKGSTLDSCAIGGVRLERAQRHRDADQPGNSAQGGTPTVSGMTQIASGYVHRTDPAALVVGPTGLAFDPVSGTL
jgi:hypothetical protein